MKNYIMRVIASVLVISSFVMCTKETNKVDIAANLTPVETTVITAATNSPTYTVQPSQWFVDGTNIAAGTIVYIPAGTRGALLLKNFKGTTANPIVIINKGGKVTFSTTATASYAFKTQNCRHFKVLGNGVASIKYGINVNGGNIGMTMDDLSSNFEIASVEVHNSGFAGIMAKTDPTCDVLTQRGRFTMRNVMIHDNYVHNTGGEGLYVGNSFYADGITISCGKVLPHDIENAKIYNNITDSTGCEGIQVGSATLECEIYNNTVKSPGLKPFASGQDNGIQVGEGTGGKCYNNLVKNAPGNGIIVLGRGYNLVYNNYILDAKAYGIFADSRFTPGPYFRFINNTIINPGFDAIKLNSETIPMNVVINNVMIIPGSGVAINKKSTSVKVTASNNYVGKDLNALRFKNYSQGDFHLLSTSPLVNNGADVLKYDVSSDYYGKARPSGVTYDIGATEY